MTIHELTDYDVSRKEGGRGIASTEDKSQSSYSSKYRLSKCYAVL